jgi:beta-RFAP synthase
MDTAVIVRAPARLHLGFIDLHGGLGRRFCGVGLAIEGLDAVVTARPAPSGTCRVRGVEAQRAAQHARQVLATLGPEQGIDIDVQCAAPAHVGLGSGTQLGLAVAAAIAATLHHALEPRDLAAVVGRGQRSGIGIAAFEGGGLIVDGGRGDAARPAPCIARLPFPPAWRVMLVFDDAQRGLHGAGELRALATLPPMTADEATTLARWCLVGLLPAVAEGDFESFSRALAEIQARNGAYFAPHQGGSHFTSPRVAALLAAIRQRHGLHGLGQSSWGPTGFVCMPDPAVAADVARAFAHDRARGEGLRIETVTACNRGAIIAGRVGRMPQRERTGTVQP